MFRDPLGNIHINLFNHFQEYLTHCLLLFYGVMFRQINCAWYGKLDQILLFQRKRWTRMHFLECVRSARWDQIRGGGVPKIQQDSLRRTVLKILHPGKNCHWTPLWSCHLLPLSGFLQVFIVIVFKVFIKIMMITTIMFILCALSLFSKFSSKLK